MPDVATEMQAELAAVVAAPWSAHRQPQVPAPPIERQNARSVARRAKLSGAGPYARSADQARPANPPSVTER